MMEERKVTVKYFLNKRMNPRVVNGIDHYPLYVQVTFLSNNTKMLARTKDEEKIYMAKEGLEALRAFLYEKSYWHRDLTFYHLLDKKLLIEDTVLEVYKDLGERFSFSLYSHLFIIWQKSIWYLLDQYCVRYLDFWAEQIEKQSLYLKEDRGNVGALILRYDKGYIRYHNQYGVDPITDIGEEGLVLIKCLLAYIQFHQYHAMYELRRDVMNNRTPTSRDTIYSWLYKNEQQKFIDFYTKSYELITNGYPVNRVSNHILSKIKFGKDEGPYLAERINQLVIDQLGT